MSKILIAGGSGCVGKILTPKLIESGNDVAWLSRSSKNNTIKTYVWNPEKGEIDETCMLGVDYIINLSGEGIADKKWSEKRKDILLKSRILPLKLLHQTISKQKTTIKGIISASAIGYYGAVSSDKIFTENDLNATDFLGETCKKWENEMIPFENLNIPTTIIRTGLVLSSKCGALPTLAKPFQYYIGSGLGSGKQWMPWIHIEDLTNIFIWSINNQKSGVYNAVAPEHVNNQTFSISVANQMNKPLFPINPPEFLLKMILGEMSVIVLKGSRVSCQKLTDEGYRFSYPTHQKALNNLLRT
jgi:uncharacterized protein